MTTCRWPSVIVTMAAYNEEATIGEVIRGCLERVGRVIVVDDGSSDATAARASDAGATVVRHSANGGYDAALETAFQCARAYAWDVLVTMDADGQHRLEDLDRVVEPLVAGEADVSLGQRDCVTHACERLYAAYTRSRFGVADPLCGLKGYSRAVCERMGHFDTCQSIGTQLMCAAIAEGYRVARVPVEVRPRRDTSRFYLKKLRGNYRIACALWAIARRHSFSRLS